MKLRIKSNSVRYRLTRSDISALIINGNLQEQVYFGETVLKYELKLTENEHISASYINNVITVMMPSGMMDDWLTNDKVGFEAIDNGLHLLIEKDFTCLDNVDEDQSDNYPNPLAAKN